MVFPSVTLQSSAKNNFNLPVWASFCGSRVFSWLLGEVTPAVILTLSPRASQPEEPQVPACCCCWWMWRHHYLLPSPITPSAHVCPFLSSLWWRGQLSFPSDFPYLRPFTVVCLSPTTWPLNCHWQLLSRCGSSRSPLPVVTAILPSTRGNTRIVGLFS